MKTIRVYGNNGDQLSPEQLLVGEILATPGRANMKLEEIGAAAGVSSRTISRWREQPAFNRYVQKRTVELVGQRLPAILSTVADRAEQGSAKHAELILKTLNLLNAEVVLRPGQPEDIRSNDAIRADIDRLSAVLEDMDKGEKSNDIV